MKKTYITPTTGATLLHCEGMLAASGERTITSDEKELNSTGDIYSKRSGWSSDNWTNNDD